MFARNTLRAWVGIVFLCAMFLLGQNTWGPPPLPRDIPDTGITRCYDNTQEIECPSPGEAFYGQDAHYETHPLDCTDHGDGTVTDNVTGLMWQKCSAGLSGSDCSVGEAEAATWSDAVARCPEIDLGGHQDWRLPGENELQSLVHYGRYDPAVDPVAFPGTGSLPYWSSSLYAGHESLSWYVHFDAGHVDREFNDTGLFPLRCVRGPRSLPSFTPNGDGTVTDNVTGLMWQQQDDEVPRSWEDALAYCQAVHTGGHTDWRLPDIKQLKSLVDTSRHDPAIDPVAFPGAQSRVYWSSSTYAWEPSGAWYVYFGLGYVGNVYKADTYYVRCVR